MQKKLIALAIAGLASTAAFAQSNVTIYGVMDASIDMIDVGDSQGSYYESSGKNGRREIQINSNSSRIGFKGSEDLGNGLKAIFQIESSIAADGSSAGSLNSRNTFVGLAGNFGTVFLGRHDTPYKMATRSLDLFADHLGDTRNIMGQSAASLILGESDLTFDNRQSNGLTYMSPDFNGFAFNAAYVLAGEGENSYAGTSRDGIISLNGTYTAGPWYGAVAYEKHDAGSWWGNPADSQKAWKIGGGYKQDALRINAVYERTDADTSMYSGELDRSSFTLAAGYTVGNNEFKIAYTHAGDTGDFKDTGAKQWAIGVDHVLSKRTKLYAEYVRITNEANAFYCLGGAHTTAAGDLLNSDGSDPSALQLGIRHSF